MTGLPVPDKVLEQSIAISVVVGLKVRFVPIYLTNIRQRLLQVMVQLANCQRIEALNSQGILHKDSVVDFGDVQDSIIFLISQPSSCITATSMRHLAAYEHLEDRSVATGDPIASALSTNGMKLSKVTMALLCMVPLLESLVP